MRAIVESTTISQSMHAVWSLEVKLVCDRIADDGGAILWIGSHEEDYPTLYQFERGSVCDIWKKRRGKGSLTLYSPPQ